MKITIERAVLRKAQIKDLKANDLFTLSEDSNCVYQKVEVRLGNRNELLKTVIPEGFCIVSSLSCGYIELMDEKANVLPMDGEFLGKIKTL